MSDLIFSRWWGDPAEHLDERREFRKRQEELEKQERERYRIKRARKIRKLTKQAMARQLKGQK